MIAFKIESIVQVPFHIVVNHFSEDLFQALAPSFPPSRLISFDGDRVGGLVKIELGKAPLSQIWISEITHRIETDQKLEFIDVGVQLPPPLKTWQHRHVVERISDDETLIIDDIQASSGSRLIDLAMRPVMYRMFKQRTPAYKKYFDGLAATLIDD